MAEETVKITPVSENEINDLLNLGGADNVITPVDTKPTPFRKEPDADFSIKDLEEPAAPAKKAEETVEETLDVLKISDEEVVDTKPDKDLELAALESLVKKEKLFLFSGEGYDNKPLSEYSKKEREELLEANLERIQKEAEEKTPAEFFEALPAELQYAAKYVFEGGTDLQTMFAKLAKAEEIKKLDISTEKGQEDTVRTYLRMQGDLSDQEIEEEITSLKDLNTLEKKAGVYKPKVDAKQQQIIEKQIKDQEELTRKHQEQAVKYKETVLAAIQPGVINDLKLTPTVAGMLFNGLTQANYPSVSGKNTNLLGHLMEKYNYVEPNPQLMAEVLWLLKDPKAYREAVKTLGSNAAAAETFRELKKAGQTKTTATTTDTAHQNTPAKRTIKKQGNIFARPQ